MLFTDGGYSSAQFDNKELRKVALRMANTIPRAMAEMNAQAVVVTGKSGISIAFATLMLVEFPLIVVRKEGENSHGNRIEGTPGVNVQRYIVLDDFVSSGSTIRNIMEQMEEYRSSRQWQDGATNLKCVAVVEWSSVHNEQHGMPFMSQHGLEHLIRYTR